MKNIYSTLLLGVIALLAGCVTTGPLNEEGIGDAQMAPSENFASGPGFSTPGALEASPIPEPPSQDRFFPVVNIDKKVPPPPPEPIDIEPVPFENNNQADPRLGGQTPNVRQAPAFVTPNNDPVLESGTGAIQGYRLRPLDQIIINVLEPNKSTSEDIIDEQGFITMQYIGRLQAAGQTTSELEKIIEKTYIEKQIYNRMTVNVIVPLRTYSMQGEINRPGRYPLSGVITLLEAIADSGNFTEYSNKKKILIIRNGVQLEPIDYNDALIDNSKNIIIQPNDIIRVPRGW